MGGEQVASLVAEPHWTSADVFAELGEQPPLGVKLRLLFDLQEVSGQMTLGDAGITAPTASLSLSMPKCPWCGIESLLS
jgi:hypothetical protein